VKAGGVVVRRLVPEDAEGLVACVRRVYEGGYPQEDLYDPAAIVRHNASEEWISIVAVDREILGHLCVEPSRFGPIAETGMGMVLPELRRAGLLERLRDTAIALATARGLRGYFSEVGTDNAAVQGLSNRSTVFPTGITLGVWPRSMASREAGRQNFIRVFRYLQEPLPVALHAPLRHRAILARIYDQMGVPVRFEPPRAASGEPRVVVDRRPRWQTTFVTMTEVGEGGALREALSAVQGDALTEHAFLELPLAQPGAEGACACAEDLGFFFAGVTPFGAREGEALRLQWRRRATPISEPGVTHPFARELLDYIAAEAVARGRSGAMMPSP
jgi:hypothetical protein